ncbi:MAG TPA: hypothetical protein VMV09_05985 [Candidatus Saccharimonadales bacterium]|nr:hypothetical protein [Candidatus Saccharimonadales bacterium]
MPGLPAAALGDEPISFEDVLGRGQIAVGNVVLPGVVADRDGLRRLSGWEMEGL